MCLSRSLFADLIPPPGGFFSALGRTYLSAAAAALPSPRSEGPEAADRGLKRKEATDPRRCRSNDHQSRSGSASSLPTQPPRIQPPPRRPVRPPVPALPRRDFSVRAAPWLFRQPRDAATGRGSQKPLRTAASKWSPPSQVRRLRPLSVT